MHEKKLTTPVAIIIVGVLIAGAILFSTSKKGNAKVFSNTQETTQEASDYSTDKVAKVTKDDHIRGNPNASIKIVEYSDFECPFCQRFQLTMKQVMDEYEADGQVAWVYRHFPLSQLHPKNAKKAAIASECVTEQAGNDEFWKFADEYFARTPANDRADENLIPGIIKDIGIDMMKFEKCLNSGEYDNRINDNIANAVETGGQGTPWSIIILPNGETIPLSGAYPYESIKEFIDTAIKDR